MKATISIIFFFSIVIVCGQSPSPLDTIKETESIGVYVSNMQRNMKERDFGRALTNINKALAAVKDSTEANLDYLELVVYKSEVYSWFQRLDEAERTILIAMGLNKDDVETIVKSIDKSADEKLITLAEKIKKYPSSKTRIGPHIGLSLIYNILGDSIKLQKEQQLMFERPKKNKSMDWVIKTSFALFKVRQSKVTAYGYIWRIKEAMKTEGETRNNQKYLAHYLYQIGEFKKAGIISDKYLAIDKNDIDFLFVKMNIAMALGNVAEMKNYEDKLRSINPKLLGN
tara:strand:- start:1104 stop:1958 length:855 start_codon:yes stop_codon:yes gene_type:complete